MKIVQEHVASRQLPGLLTARLYHACAAYTVEGAQVELKNWAKIRFQMKTRSWFRKVLQMLVVAGGADAALQLIESTEVDRYSDLNPCQILFAGVRLQHRHRMATDESPSWAQVRGQRCHFGR